MSVVEKDANKSLIFVWKNQRPTTGMETALQWTKALQANYSFPGSDFGGGSGGGACTRRRHDLHGIRMYGGLVGDSGFLLLWGHPYILFL